MEDDSKELEYLKVLRAVDIIPFNVGKNLLIDFLQGNSKNESIKRNRLEKKELFGHFSMFVRQELEDMVENLLHNGLVEYAQVPENKFIKVIAITEKGRKELHEPSLYKKKLQNRFFVKETSFSEKDRMMFDAFDFFLAGYNDEQKKAIVNGSEKILCIAGAGSGKTTVLTKRIEFLTTFRSVEPNKILAITFTRKARAEMEERISKSPYCSGVVVETFNSFCEKIIKQNNDAIYSTPTRVISYSDKIRIFRGALKENSIEPALAIEQYFSFGQRRGKTNEELLNMFMNDCYSVLELYKINSKSLEELKKISKELGLAERGNAAMVYGICSSIDASMKKSGLRDYCDQLSHCISFFRNNPGSIPKFEHVLIDEYQDVNSSQIELVNLLNPSSLFCVGDPRQSIFGWRGSKIKYILDFEENHHGCEIITLSTNYRSTSQIVELINKALENSRLPQLKAGRENSGEMHLVNFESEDDEINFIVSKIAELDVPRSEIFVLARTNRVLSEVSLAMKARGIRHLVKTEEKGRDEEAREGEVTLATIHSIKGLEADTVFVAGCTVMNFPCKTSDHPIIEIVKIDDYDKEEEERRLFYVALSRAKKTVYLTYCGKIPTRFINPKMLQMLKSDHGNQVQFQTKENALSNPDYLGDKLLRLKIWRKETAQKLNLPAYVIMHDKTLLDIVEMNPVDAEDLKNVRGIGPAKLERYGKEIMDIINGGK